MCSLYIKNIFIKYETNVILIGMAFDVSTFQQLVDSSKYNILYIGESEFVQNYRNM